MTIFRSIPRKLKIGLALLCLLAMGQSCLIINENEYRTLSPQHFDRIVLFDVSLMDRDWPPGEQLLIEVDNNDIDLITQQSSFTWVRLWRPFCPSESCENLALYAAVAEKHPDLTFMLISETYGLKDISEKFRQSNFKLPVYVLRDSVYGHKMTPARKKFTAETGRGQLIQPQFLDNDFLFTKDSLIFAGEDLVMKLDSLLNASKGKQ
ncbi:MAG: hypothetical protein RBR28_04170 [Lentimicrobium sp.]|jgi:hypothetical protein|nr:hypothetical protein [Lentimicrobium sp.]